MIYFIRAGATGAALAALLLGSSAHGQTATDFWHPWIVEGFDDGPARMQSVTIALFDNFAECAKGVDRLKHDWSGYVLYCLPADTVPAAGVRQPGSGH